MSCGKFELNRKTCFAKEFPSTKFKVHTIFEILLVFGKSREITGWVKLN